MVHGDADNRFRVLPSLMRDEVALSLLRLDRAWVGGCRRYERAERGEWMVGLGEEPNEMSEMIFSYLVCHL